MIRRIAEIVCVFYITIFIYNYVYKVIEMAADQNNWQEIGGALHMECSSLLG